jgi:hypothetical protein
MELQESLFGVLAAALFAICSWQPSDSVGVWVNVGPRN